MRASDQMIVDMTNAAGKVAIDTSGLLQGRMIQNALDSLNSDLPDVRTGYDAMLIQTLVTKYGCKIVASDGTPLTFL